MLHIQKTLALSQTYPLERLGDRDSLLFFDIETTGFSADSSALYLIGCLYYRKEAWHFVQWFADSPQSEIELLHAFFQFLSNFSTVVHFNGDSFDLPYLQKRCAHYRLPYDFSALSSIDIYKKIRPCRKWLGLDSLRLKAVERFLGIQREDPYHGGALIAVYHSYLRHKDEQRLHCLLLHNEEDLLGMLSILPILCYPDLETAHFRLSSQSLPHTEEASPSLFLQAESDIYVPKPFSASLPNGSLSMEQNRLTLSLSLFEGTLKYFYPDYKNYYYLPAEDRAIHKSVGEFVDKSARKRATAQTGYQKASGLFLPQLSPILEPVFCEKRASSLTYVPYTEALLENPQHLSLFLRHLLSHAEAM
ncbi:MAG: ribonuclease H-like domain-containing protein [bacterium]|nr:ribonuclease H-like domain-containing protein [bacterium]